MRLDLTVLPLAVSLLFAPACSSDSGSEPGPGSGTGGTVGAVNEEPPVANTSTVELREGLTTVVSFDDLSTGNTVAELLDVPAGVEAKLGDGSVELFADYRTTAASLGVKLEAPLGTTADARLDLTVKPLAWGEQHWDKENGPAQREHPAVFVDEAGARMVLHGGTGYRPQFTPLDDTWEYDLNTLEWREIIATGDVPVGGGSRRVAQSPGSATGYVFGGYGANGSDNDQIFRVDLSDGGVHFTQIRQASSPGARSLHAFAYDEVSETFYLFGGVLKNDTWSMKLTDDIARWTELSFDGGVPSPRYGFFYGFDAVNRRLIVYSGAQGTNPLDPAHDTWALDVSVDPPTWKLLDDGTSESSPPGRRNGCASFDPSGTRLFVFGGTPDAQTSAPGFYVFDARPGHEKWTLLERDGELPNRSSGVGFYDPVGERNFFGFGNTPSVIYNDLTPIGY